MHMLITVEPLYSGQVLSFILSQGSICTKKVHLVLSKMAFIGTAWRRKMVWVRGATIMTHAKTSTLAFISL